MEKARDRLRLLSSHILGYNPNPQLFQSVVQSDTHSLNVVPTAGAHPLDPLTSAEISEAVRAVKSHAGFDLEFETVGLLEPSKDSVTAWKRGVPCGRIARVISRKEGELGVYRAHVDLDKGLTDWEFLKGVRTQILPEDFVKAVKAAAQSKDVLAALKRRGLEFDPKKLHVEPWPAGNFPGDDDDGKALVNLFFWVRLEKTDNPYAHPVEGLNVIVDRISNTVVEVQDHVHGKDIPPIPKGTPAHVNYHRTYHSETFQQAWLAPFRPLNIQQPEGVSFEMQGRSLTWHKWSLHVGFSVREGIVLGDISFAGRKILHSACVAEMVVPYGSPVNSHYRKNVFDTGEVGFGRMVNSLKLGCDCKGVIHYLDAFFATASGEPCRVENAICIHEEDHSILWKHVDRVTGSEVRRARRLVISSIHTVGNYEYGCYWYLMMDGSIEFEMKATGILNTTGCAPGLGQQFSGIQHGTEVAPGVFGQFHQHIFTARLDLAIDGERNSVVECDTVREPLGAASNPYGNAFHVKETLLETELRAMRLKNDETARFWRFINPSVKNAMGRPVGYRLEPIHATKPQALPDSPSGRRMNHVFRDLWVTAYDREQRSPAGEFVNNSDGSEGLSSWVKADRVVADADIVAWYNFGLHHIVRLEDFPVQNVVSTGFMLHPDGFFDRNPCLDVPP